jgi:hypothetical protein
MASMDSLRAYLAGLLVVVAGCGGKSVGGASAPPVAEADFGATFAQAMCDTIGTCCSLAGMPSDAQACAGDVSSITGPAAYPYRTYDPVRGGQCVALVRAIAPSCVVTGSQSDALNHACATAYVGHQAAGAPCSDDLDCAGGQEGTATCDTAAITPSSYQPTCRAVQIGGAGARCDTYAPVVSGQTGKVYDKCMAGLVCGANATCAPPAGAGQPCAMYLTGGCAGDNTCVNGLCGPKKANGALCSSKSECQSGVCIGATCAAGSTVTQNDCGGSAYDTPPTVPTKRPIVADAGG